MRRAVDLPRLSHWLAFILQAAGVCIFGFIVPRWYQRDRLSPIDDIIVGTFLGYFSWSAAWCALGPGRWICRYLVVVSAGVAITGALMAGIDSKHETHAEGSRAAIARSAWHVSPRERARNDVWRLGLALPLLLLGAQVPLVWNRFYRGWRIVFLRTESQSPEIELLKFGVSDLLGATAGAALASAAWRLEISELSRDPYGTEMALVATLGCIFLSLIVGVVLLPLVPLVLADRPRPIALASAAATAGGIAIVLTVAVFWLNAPLRWRLGSAAAIFAYLAVLASSAVGVFWIGRELRYRFVRTRRRGVFERWNVVQRAWRFIGKANQFNRALFSWFAIGCTAIAGACTLLWLVSLCTAKADLRFMYGVEDEITVAHGTITVNTILSVRNARSAWAGSSKPSRWMAPGLEVEHMEDYDGRTWLIVKCSLLIPALTAAILAAFFHRFRQLRQAKPAGPTT